MDERYLKILFNLYHYKYFISNWKLLEYPKLKTFNINKKYI